MQSQCSNIELLIGVACLPHVYAYIHDFLIFVKSKSDTNLLVLADIHSDYVNGQLVHSSDKHGEYWTQDAFKVDTG